MQLAKNSYFPLFIACIIVPFYCNTTQIHAYEYNQNGLENTLILSINFSEELPYDSTNNYTVISSQYESHLEESTKQVAALFYDSKNQIHIKNTYETFQNPYNETTRDFSIIIRFKPIPLASHYSIFEKIDLESNASILISIINHKVEVLFSNAFIDSKKEKTPSIRLQSRNPIHTNEWTEAIVSYNARSGRFDLYTNKKMQHTLYAQELKNFNHSKIILGKHFLGLIKKIEVHKTYTKPSLNLSF